MGTQRYSIRGKVSAGGGLVHPFSSSSNFNKIIRFLRTETISGADWPTEKPGDFPVASA